METAPINNNILFTWSPPPPVILNILINGYIPETFITIPESRIEILVGAEECASGSQLWNGTSPPFVKAPHIKRQIAIVIFKLPAEVLVALLIDIKDVLPEINIKIEIDRSINNVAVTERTIYLNALSKAALSLYIDINIKEETATISMNTYSENISVTITTPFIPAKVSIIKFAKLNFWSSS
jgi:hypothetical protein